LIPESRTPFDGQSLIRVDERLANGQRIWGAVLQMDAHKGSWHGWVAGQEERLSRLQETREAIADGIRAQIRPVVAHSHHNSGRLVAWELEKELSKLLQDLEQIF